MWNVTKTDRVFNQTEESRVEPMFSIWLFDIKNVLSAILVSVYGLIIFLGIFWNVLIIRAYMSNRLPRNIILLHVCIADLLVCSVSGPSTVIIILQPKWNIGWFSCKVVYFVQSIPMVTSTMLLMMLSIDRYVTIRRPAFFAKFNRKDQQLNKILAAISWTVAIVICIPILLVRQVDNDVCTDIWSDQMLRNIYVVCYILVLYFLPMGIVAKCHFSVGTGIFSASIFEAMANGDVPLPMPIQAPNQAVIILASVNEMNPMFTKNERKLSTNQELALDARNEILKRQSANAVASGSRGGLRDRLRLFSRSNNQSMFPPAPTSFKVRRKMAKMLIVMAIVFAVAWFPYVSGRLVLEFVPDYRYSRLVDLMSLFLLLGHSHSALNPFVYWFLNRQSIPVEFSFRSWLPWNWGSHRRNILRRMARYIAGEDDDHYSRSSSTNEAQLGVFHPRFTRPRRNDQAEDMV
ncbi:orexin/Hypocretin receptor type 1 [Planococcus citri]|uniref:orexin/Hypocretin receptor type 1 n=1 Tax=Planococcus citri TaxID=170843 RepID=UPI0031FA3D6A